MTPRNVVLEGDAREVLAGFAPGSVDCVITSPPYVLLRDYDAGPDEIGTEPTVDAWVSSVLGVCREVRRVLAPHGSFFLNVGDSYSRHAKYGAQPKSLLGAPDRLLVALIADGWTCRNKVVWQKSAPLPSPVGDRLTSTYELVFHLVKERRYFYDLDQIRVPLTSKRRPRQRDARPARPAALGRLAGPRRGLSVLAAEGRTGHALGKNPGDVWRLPPGRSVGGHPATFPESLVRPMILATCPARVCTQCGEPWHRSAARVRFASGEPQRRELVPCHCGAPTRPGLLLDPFAGSGTALKVAREAGRDVLGIELAPRFAELARTRAGLTNEQLEAAR